MLERFQKQEIVPDDATPSDEVNYLVARYGLNRNRFIAVGNGSKNASSADSEKDRRTDIKILSR